MNQEQDIKKINGEWFVYFDIEDECTECGTNINHSGFYNIQKALDKINSKPQASPIQKARIENTKAKKDLLNELPTIFDKARSDNNDFKAHKSSPKPCPNCFPDDKTFKKSMKLRGNIECLKCKGQGFIKS